MKTHGFKIVDSGSKKWPIGNNLYYPATWVIGQLDPLADRTLIEPEQEYIHYHLSSHCACVWGLFFLCE